MLSWAVGFFIIALIAAFFGFGGVAASAAGMAKVLFVGFLILSAAALIASLLQSRISSHGPSSGARSGGPEL